MKQISFLLLCLLLTGCSVTKSTQNILLPTTNDVATVQLNDESDAIPVYPENFLQMSGEPIDFSQLSTPQTLYTHEGANGTVELLDYGVLDVISLKYDGEDYFIEYDFKDSQFITSEGVSVGSTKVDVLKAYEKYGVQEYSHDKLSDFNIRYSSVVVLDDKKNTNNFLYVNNWAVFREDYRGTDYWDGLVAYVFIFDNSDVVTMIIRVAPTAG